MRYDAERQTEPATRSVPAQATPGHSCLHEEPDFLDLEAWIYTHAPQAYEVGHYLQVETACRFYLTIWRKEQRRRT